VAGTTRTRSRPRRTAYRRSAARPARALGLKERACDLAKRRHDCRGVVGAPENRSFELLDRPAEPKAHDAVRKLARHGFGHKRCGRDVCEYSGIPAAVKRLDANRRLECSAAAESNQDVKETRREFAWEEDEFVVCKRVEVNLAAPCERARCSGRV
jgi:hypothetical protein